MKFNYLLEIYDTLISEILNSKNSPTSQIIEFVTSNHIDSFNIYTVDFNNANTSIKYRIEDPVHNWHPRAPLLKDYKNNIVTDLEKLLPQIEQELNIEHLNKKLIWSVAGNSTKLFILVDINLEEIEKDELNFLYYNQLLKIETETIQKKIKETISELNSKEQIETYILKKQLALSNLVAKLIKIIKPKNANDVFSYSTTYSDQNGLKIIYYYVEKAIRFLEKEYFKYLDKNSQASIKTILNTKVHLAPIYNALQLGFNRSADQKAIIILLECFSKIIKVDFQQKITYNELLFASDILPILYNQISNKQKTKKWLKDIMLEFNFNSLEFFDFYTDEINKELNKHEDDIEKFKILYRYLKNTNQKQLYTNNKWNPNLPSAKKQIAGWLEEEIQYLNQQRVLQSYSTEHPISVEMKTKFHTDLSVPQLSYFFGLLIQVGIIQPPTQRAIFRFIADHFKTKMTNSISVDSLNSKYYNVELTTKNAVREKIIELLNFTKL
ncbi:hypothetical protein SLW70_08095 [Flavobacterium sp. NG2]|uniref:hypothetical protein n=1 Tax=Flavobacterium sp. NG2 TaxID=3097547 RepID=UPI002A80D2A8|nr:hypothetical protein [Flavobacterium sp. NG2]WPR73066.1 hypothetical protein SLW70_08095 [Flavobacterium sp. NG2]